MTTTWWQTNLRLAQGPGLLYLNRIEYNEFQWTGNGPGIDLDLSLTITRNAGWMDGWRALSATKETITFKDRHL